MNQIPDREAEIVEEFASLDGDLELTLQYLMELGERLPEYPEEARTEDNIVKGCQSKVWLNLTREDGRMRFQADSNTAITKGLVSLLVRIYDNATPEEALAAELSFPGRIGMDRFIGTQRSNGFASMIRQFRHYARACQALDQNTVS